MKKMVFILTGFFVIAFSANIASSSPYTIDDVNLATQVKVGVGYSYSNYGYGGDVDFIGAEFDTRGINVSFAGTKMTIDLYTKFDGSYNAGGVELLLADLFFDTNGDRSWDSGIDMANASYLGAGKGVLYTDITKTLTSYDYLYNKPSSGYWMYGAYYPGSGWNPSPIVKIDGGEQGPVIDVTSQFDGDLYKYSMAIETTSLGLVGGQTLGIHWATAYCANDLVIGRVDVPTAPVPEPATMLLFGAGLVGLAGARFRSRKKK